MGIWKECFSHTWLPCVRTDLIYFKNLATGSLFRLFPSGSKMEEQQQAVVCICFLPDRPASRREIISKGYERLNHFNFVFIKVCHNFFPPSCPRRTEGREEEVI